MKRWSKWLALVLALFVSVGSLTACENSDVREQVSVSQETDAGRQSASPENAVALPQVAETFDPAQVPSYTGAAYTVVHDNVPYFSENELTTKAFEQYSPLDGYGRCGVAYACVGQELMPTEERGSIGQVKPSGWHTVRYDGVDGKYLYNRCHLIGYQLSGENANVCNLITGTRALNMEGMLPFENMVADYVKETDNHVLYRVTPVFQGANLVASGVLMEGYSVEDEGAGICYCVYAYNVQPGITIDYASGESWQDAATPAQTTQPEVTPAPSSDETAQADAPVAEAAQTYVLNNNTMKFHDPSCRSVRQMKAPQEVTTTRQSLIDQGYSPCGNCNP